MFRLSTCNSSGKSHIKRRLGFTVVIDEQGFDLVLIFLQKGISDYYLSNPAHHRVTSVGATVTFTQTNVDHAELIWEEFTHGIQTFSPTKQAHKARVIIYYLASNNNIHRRPDSAVHHTGDDYILGNLKFVPKGESVEVFGMAIPDPLITEAIQPTPLLSQVYLKRVAENKRKPLKKCKHANLLTKPFPQKVRKGKAAFQLVDEDDDAQQESIPQRADDVLVLN
ncbi:hypothetical protein Tco_0067278 [Tanacetum coccineum]